MTETVSISKGEYETLRFQVETLTERVEEATLDAQRLLDNEDLGWAVVAADGENPVITRETVIQVSAVGRVMVVADPLIKRGVGLRIAYLGYPEISADAGEEAGEQDVNEVVQSFLDDPSNQDTFASAQAFEERERLRATDGNTFHCLVTNPRSGRVQVRHIPMNQIVEIVSDPEDAVIPWLYLRSYTAKVVEQGYNGLTRIRRETRRVYYPDINFRPRSRPRTIDGIPVEWDKPVVHTSVNRPEGSQWGVPDVTAALPWAKGYKSALEDWAKHHKALASIAFRVAVNSKRGAAAVRARLPIASGEAGQTVIQSADSTLETVKTAGAALPATAAEPLAGLVAAALDVPKTMLLSDPGTTGARAVAETLDKPMELDRIARRRLDTGLIQTVLLHVIREAVRVNRLKGRIYRDPDTDREIVELAGEQDPGLNIDWPELEETDMKSVLEALSIAHTLDRVPPLVIARMVLVALGAENVDEILAELQDDDGNFVPPSHELAERMGLSIYDGVPTPPEEDEE